MKVVCAVCGQRYQTKQVNEYCPSCGGEGTLVPIHGSFILKKNNESLTYLLPSNINVYQCRYCQMVFTWIPFTPEKGTTDFYYRRQDPQFCPHCGRPF